MQEVNAGNHAQQQAFKVYGVRLSVADLDIIKRKIRQGQATFAANSAIPDAAFYFYTWAGVEMKFLYNARTDTIPTVVPIEFRGESHKKKTAQRKKEFFRHFDDDEEEQ